MTAASTKVAVYFERRGDSYLVKIEKAFTLTRLISYGCLYAQPTLSRMRRNLDKVQKEENCHSEGAKRLSEGPLRGRIHFISLKYRCFAQHDRSNFSDGLLNLHRVAPEQGWDLLSSYFNHGQIRNAKEYLHG